ncbi:uncharacterized protein LOC109814533 [Cajanus cajan]|uniref:uncharacterized protein LOC109814533 n=1 Tax=Cajanus cajan TaxID=3821 RepID=UPI00098D81AB|nr:uncharacterized protein LOC109814533 [Cajanus cajan]
MNGRITSFYFEKFPPSYREQDLWKVFQRWGRVWEVFIAARRNAKGYLYGFVKFIDVWDVKALEVRLDKVYIGSVKLNVNISRFSKEETTKKKHETKIYRREAGRKDTQRSYVDVVNGNAVQNIYQEVKTVAPRSRHTRAIRTKKVMWCEKKPSIQGNSEDEEWTEITMKVPEVCSEWLRESWVARLHSLEDFDRLEGLQALHGNEKVRLRYFGDDLVLISGLQEMDLMEAEKGENSEFWALFYDINRWDPTTLPGSRLTWVRCYGVPLHMWNEQYFSQVVCMQGSLVKVDSDTATFKTIESARLLIKTSSQLPIQQHSRFKINGIRTQIRLVEETAGLYPNCKCYLWRDNSEILQSNESVCGGDLHSISDTIEEDESWDDNPYAQDISPAGRSNGGARSDCPNSNSWMAGVSKVACSEAMKSVVVNAKDKSDNTEKSILQRGSFRELVRGEGTVLGKKVDIKDQSGKGHQK